MITSTDNAKVREACRLVAKKRERVSRSLFVAEGEKLLFEAPPELVKSIFCTEDFYNRHKDNLPGDITELVSDKVFAHISDTETPQGVLALMEMRFSKPDDIYGSNVKKCLILFLEDIRDPGNLGTIVRSAEAAGVTGIIMSKGCTDIYSPKVVRSTMSSIYRIPFCYTEDFYGEIRNAKKNKIRTFSAYLKSSIPYYKADFRDDCAILIGNEAAGLSEEAAQASDERIIIPMSGQTESLNAAVAASVIVFEAKRQRSS